jgi:GNAT superfamily N-acetyltransferase
MTMATNSVGNGDAEHVALRPAGPVDAEAVCGLLTVLGYPAEERVVRERIEAFAGSVRDHVLLAEADGRVVGVLALNLAPQFAESGMFSRITALAVDPSTHRAGIGRRLVVEAERIAVAAGSTVMQVNSGRRPERAAAHAFYTSLGYADQHGHHILYEKVLGPAEHSQTSPAPR